MLVAAMVLDDLIGLLFDAVFAVLEIFYWTGRKLVRWVASGPYPYPALSFVTGAAFWIMVIAMGYLIVRAGP